MKETHRPWRKFRLEDEPWNDYGDLVGTRERSEDLRAYVHWRLANPDTPLPKARRRKTASQREARDNSSTEEE